MRIYLAGPDLFRPDVAAWAAGVRGRLAGCGHQALIPVDGAEVTASGIYRSNLEMIRSADALIANLNSFRGSEPDSGTCFEVGFACALGKPVIGYLDDNRTLRQKIGSADRDGLQVEDFDLPLNLMLAVPCRIVVAGIDAAIAQLSMLSTESPKA